MDIGELMKFKPKTAPKRPVGNEVKDDEELEDDPNETYEHRAAKRRRKLKAEQKRREEEKMAMLEAEAANIASDNTSVVGSVENTLETAEGQPGVIDETVMKKLILNFEKKSLKNQEMRIKFADEPQRFMESEVELHDSIQELRNLATVPELYPSLVDLQCIQSFFGLLSHDNTDISVAIIDLIQELTDVDTLNESEEGAKALVQSLIDNQISPLLVQNLERLNDAVNEESDGIHNTLAIFENLIEFHPEICKEAVEAGLLNWLVKRLKVKVSFDNNKLYASEILSIFLQSEPTNRSKFGEMGALDSLLQQLVRFQKLLLKL